MKIVIFGLSITSSWGNGHATTFRALCRGLHGRGHEIVFFEHNTEWYEHNRDLPEPPFCKVRIYEEWNDILPAVRAELRDADVGLVGSYFPDGIAALDEILSIDVPAKAFYDIDTPITVRTLEQHGRTDYLLKRHLPELDIYFSFTGGPLLRELEQRFGVQLAVPLYCSFDPRRYRELPPEPEFECALSYMGTYAPDRQPKIDELLCGPARQLPREKFIVAGPQYPESVAWPENVERIIHLNPRNHAAMKFCCLHAAKTWCDTWKAMMLPNCAALDAPPRTAFSPNTPAKSAPRNSNARQRRHQSADSSFCNPEAQRGIHTRVRIFNTANRREVCFRFVFIRVILRPQRFFADIWIPRYASGFQKKETFQLFPASPYYS